MSITSEVDREVEGVPDIGDCPGSGRCTDPQCCRLREQRFRPWPRGPWCMVHPGTWSRWALEAHSRDISEYRSRRGVPVLWRALAPDVWPGVKPGGLRERFLCSSLGVRSDAHPESIRVYLNLLVRDVEAHLRVRRVRR